MKFTPKDSWRLFATPWQWLRGKFSRRYFFQLFGRNDVKIFIDTDDADAAFHECSLWFIAVNRLCDILSNSDIKAVRKVKGEEDEVLDSHWALDLIRKPNPLETQETFIKNCFVNYFNHSNVFIKKIKGSLSEKYRALYNLSPSGMQIEYNGNIYDKLTIEEIIKVFIFIDADGTERSYSPKDIIYIADNYSFKEGKGISRVRALNLPINNIVASERTQNMLIVSGGIKGFMSSEAGEGIAYNPIDKTERERIEKDFNQKSDLYSDDPKIKIVQANAKWNPMGYPMGEMLLDEQQLTNFGKICGALGLPKELFPFTGATYENQNQAIKNTIQNTCQPLLDSFLRKLSESIGMEEGVTLEADYSYLPIMQEDELKCAQAKMSETQRLSLLKKDGIIDAETYAEMADVEMTGDGVTQQTQNVFNATSAN